MFADETMTELQTYRVNHTVFKIIHEDPTKDTLAGGIEFDIPAEHESKITKSVFSAVRRPHVNSGHPPNDELQRIVRLSGGSEMSRIAVKDIRCATCQRAASPKTAKTR